MIVCCSDGYKQHALKKAKGAFVSESALHFDGDKPNSVVPQARDAMIIYLAAIARNARPAFAGHDATIPEDRRTGCPPSVLSCTAWGFSCLADCSASGELLPRLFNLACLRCQRTGGVFSVTLSVSARLGERRPRVLRGMPPYGVRTFLSELLRSDHLPSRRIYHRRPGGKGMNQENRKIGKELGVARSKTFLLS